MTKLALVKSMLGNPLTILVLANTVIALISDDWPPIQADKAVTIASGWMLWAMYTGIGLYLRRLSATHE